MAREINKPVQPDLWANETSRSLRLKVIPGAGADAQGGWLAAARAQLKTSHLSKYLPLPLLAVAVIVWFLAIPLINVGGMNDLGLVSVLPPGTFVALALLTASFSLLVTAPKLNTLMIFLHLAALVVMLYGITALVEAIPRFSPSWRHAGVIDYIMRNEAVNPRIDAYFNWPGFFIMGALVTQIAGLDNAIPFLQWAPVFFQLIYMGPLWMIYTSLTNSRRLVWFGIWIFYLVNWVGQDYFSPQAMNFFYFLVVIAILIKWFRKKEITLPKIADAKLAQKLPVIRRFIAQVFHGETANPAEISPLQQAFFLLMIVMIYFVSITSHQLTQFAMLASIVLLILFQRIAPRVLPVVMLVLSGMWIAYMASAFMAGRLAGMLEAFGQLDNALDANLVDRMNGSPGHMLVTQIRLVLTLGVWLAAAIGFVRQWLRGSFETSAALLVAAPFPLLGMQAYGGEMLMRIYMFSLPFAAYLAAAILFPLIKDPPSWRYTAVIGVVSAALMVIFWFGRYGNERMEYFTPAELQAVEYTYEHAEPGSLIASLTTNLPYKYINYEKYKYTRLEKDLIKGDMVSLIATLKNSRYDHSYLLLTRAQDAYLEMYYGVGTVNLARFENQLLLDPTVKVIYVNEDAKILEFTNTGAKP